jgi:hypothetical protein
MADERGIENLKLVVGFACDFTKQIAEVLEDDKFQWHEAAQFFDEALRIPGVVRSIPEVKKELADLSEEERTELYNHFAEKFDIPNDKVEVFIENAVAWTLATLALVQEFKNLKSETEEPPVE